MSFFGYTTGIPAANNNPSNDQPNMQTNTNSINSIIGIDHFGFNDLGNRGGYHSDIHQIFRIGDAAALANALTLYTKKVTTNSGVPTTDTQLFSITALGGISQLTGNAAQTEGYQWIGGVLVQWGTVTGLTGVSSTTGSITFKDRVPGAIPFPNSLFNVQVSLQQNIAVSPTFPSSSAMVEVQTGAGSGFSKTGFSYFFLNSNGSRVDGFYWIAIGN